MVNFFWIFLFVIVPVLIFVLAGIRLVNEYERVVVFRLGRFSAVKGPGLFWINPLLDKTTLIDLRIQVLDFPKQEMITKDNIPVFLNAVAYYHVIDPARAVIRVRNFREAIYQLGQTTIRAVVGRMELDELLSHRDKVNDEIRKILDEATDEWGVNISRTELKELEVPDNMKRAMARQAESERERRSRIVLAEGEKQAAEMLRQAGEIVGSSPQAIMLRFLQTIREVSTENASTVILPIPIELLSFLDMSAKSKK